MAIISGKGLANLFIPPIFGIGLTIFKSMYFNGYGLESMEMMVEIGSSTAGFVITDIVGDLLLGFEQNDDGSFSKRIEALVVEPPLHGLIYGGLKMTMTPGYRRMSMGQNVAEGAFIYATTRFFSQPFVDAVTSTDD